jgi:hypothetical protein
MSQLADDVCLARVIWQDLCTIERCTRMDTKACNFAAAAAKQQSVNFYSFYTAGTQLRHAQLC